MKTVLPAIHDTAIRLNALAMSPAKVGKPIDSTPEYRAFVKALDAAVDTFGPDAVNAQLSASLGGEQKAREFLKSHVKAHTRVVDGKLVQVKEHETHTPPKSSSGDVAKTILHQLGANRFIAMTGAKDFVNKGSGLQFRIPKAKDGINHVQVDLDHGTDTYTVIYGKMGKKNGIPEHSVISRHEGIYADQLQHHFRHHTGLDTHL